LIYLNYNIFYDIYHGRGGQGGYVSEGDTALFGEPNGIARSDGDEKEYANQGGANAKEKERIGRDETPIRLLHPLHHGDEKRK